MGFLEDLLAWAVNYVVYLIDKILAGINSFIFQVVTAFQSLVAGLVAALDQAFASIVAVMRSVVAAVEAAFQSLLAGIQSALNALWDSIYRFTVAVIDQIGIFIKEAVASLLASITTVVDKVKQYLADVIAAVKSFVVSALEELGAALAKITNAIIVPVTELLGRAEQAVVANENAIKQEWIDLVTGAESILEKTVAKLSDLATAFKKGLEGLATAVNDGVDIIDKSIGGSLIDFVEYLFKDAGGDFMERLSDTSSRLVAGQMTVTEFRSIIGGLLNTLAPTNRVLRVIGFGLFAAVIAGPAYWNIGSAYSNILLQELGMTLPFNVLQPADTVASYRRTGLTFDEAVMNIRRGGFSEADARRMVDNSLQVPDTFSVLAAWLRGIIDDGVMEDALFQQGFSAGWRGVLTDLVRLIPPVQDLITMAVREAFSPEVAERFGQFEDFPEAFAEFAGQQGLTNEWARRYWAAHWSLPSPMQGFEMLHRGVIDKDTLNLLLRALDVMPFWRDKLTAIAFNPFTRVDIRRMHALGVLDDEGILKAYQDLGYDEEHAKSLVIFTKKLNTRKPAEDDEELGKLSRSAVLGFYKDGLLSRQRAAQLLVTGGHTPEAAELYLEAVDMDVERELRSLEIVLIIDQFKAGTLTFEEAVDSFNRLGLATDEVGKAVQKLQAAQRQTTKLPSLSDGKAFYMRRLITREDFADLLGRLGYAQKWIDAYIREADLEVLDAGKSV